MKKKIGITIFVLIILASSWFAYYQFYHIPKEEMQSLEWYKAHAISLYGELQGSKNAEAEVYYTLKNRTTRIKVMLTEHLPAFKTEKAKMTGKIILEVYQQLEKLSEANAVMATIDDISKTNKYRKYDTKFMDTMEKTVDQIISTRKKLDEELFPTMNGHFKN